MASAVRTEAACFDSIIAEQFDDLTHRRAVTQARIHLANMPAERRAQLEREWKGDSQ